MKTMRFHSIIFLALAIALWTGCTKNERVVPDENEPGIAGGGQRETGIHFIATLESKSNTAWVVDEVVALYYQKTDGSYGTAEASITAVDETGKATIETGISDAMNEGTVTLVYPAYLHNGNGELNMDLLFNKQYGNLTGDNGVNNNFDAAIGTDTLSVSESGVTVSGAVTMVRQLAICKFTINSVEKEEGDGLVTAYINPISNTFYIKCGGDISYTITSDRANTNTYIGGSSAVSTTRGFQKGDDIYVAMLPYVGTITCYMTNVNGTFTTTTSLETIKVDEYYKTFQLELLYGNPETATGMTTDGIKVYSDETISGPLNETVYIADNGNITLSDATINVSSGPGIYCLGNATITLEGNNTVSTTEDASPAIQVGMSGTMLSIQGSGSLTACRGKNAAAPIGNGAGQSSVGEIMIDGSTSWTAGTSTKKHFFNVSTTTSDNDTWTLKAEDTVSGEMDSDSTITVPDGGTLTLSDATVSASPAVKCLGNATIILSGKNNLTSSADNYPAIQAGGSGTTLTIKGDGSVIATGATSAAGIGGGAFNPCGHCGDITIESGTVTAIGGESGAGIGGGTNSNCGKITISGGTVTATGKARDGSAGGAGIGSGWCATSGDITISGGNVTAIGAPYAAGIGSGYAGTYASISITSGIDNVYAKKGSGADDPIGKGDKDLKSGDVSIDGSISWTVGTPTENLIWYTATDDVWQLRNKTVTISGKITSNVTIPDGGVLIMDNANIQVTPPAAFGPAIMCLGNATIVLKGSNTVCTNDSGDPGIQIGGSNKTLTIKGEGSLNATGANYGAGIGAGDDSPSYSGNITISEGTVTATGGGYAAGIGSSLRNNIGTISIRGGTVTAIGGKEAAGIGSGSGGSYGYIGIGSGISKVSATMGDGAMEPIGRGKMDENSGSASVGIDGINEQSSGWGKDTENLNWVISGNTWILTHK